MTLNELQRIKQWHVAHRADHPIEYHLWDAILTLWVMGWVGFLPAYAFEQFWTLPLCALAIAAPGMYVVLAPQGPSQAQAALRLAALLTACPCQRLLSRICHAGDAARATLAAAHPPEGSPWNASP